MCAGFFAMDFFGLTEASAAAAVVFVEFPHCILSLFGQLGLALGPFFRKFLTALDASGISLLSRCQWRS